jgi:hypothetical protein
VPANQKKTSPLHIPSPFPLLLPPPPSQGTPDRRQEIPKGRGRGKEEKGGGRGRGRGRGEGFPRGSPSPISGRLSILVMMIVPKLGFAQRHAVNSSDGFITGFDVVFAKAVPGEVVREAFHFVTKLGRVREDGG